MNDTQTRVQLEFEGVKPIRQAFPYEFQRGFLETPESEKVFDAIAIALGQQQSPAGSTGLPS